MTNKIQNNDLDISMSKLSNLCRSTIRNFPFWHSSLKRIFKKVLPSRNIIIIKSSLQMIVDHTRSNQNSIYWFYEETEPALQWAIRTLLPIGGRFVDCGANIGLMGLLAIHERQAKTLFIEPFSRLADGISDSLVRSGYKDQGIVIQCAASDRNGEADFFLHPTGDGCHSLYQNSKSVECIKVITRRLDKILSGLNWNHIDFLKIDTEGHDLKVLEGLGDMINPKRIAVIHSEMGKEGKDIAVLLDRRGYVPFQALNCGMDKLSRANRKSSEHLISFFREVPYTHIKPHNWLWVGRGTAYHMFLKRLAATGIAVDNL